MIAAYAVICVGAGLVFGTFGAITVMLLQGKDLRR